VTVRNKFQEPGGGRLRLFHPAETNQRHDQNTMAGTMFRHFFDRAKPGFKGVDIPAAHQIGGPQTMKHIAHFVVPRADSDGSNEAVDSPLGVGRPHMHETEAVERLGRVGVQSQCTVECGGRGIEVPFRCVGPLVREIRESPPGRSRRGRIVVSRQDRFACQRDRRFTIPWFSPTRGVAYAIGHRQICLCEFVGIELVEPAPLGSFLGTQRHPTLP
jgi:hypothetical protein